MASPLDKQLACFLRQRRGGESYASFAKRLGITPSTLYRLENSQQSVTLGKLDAILAKLKCHPRDVFSAPLRAGHE